MKRLAVLLVLAACGGDADSRWSGSIETLPNGAVRVSNPAQGLWEDGAGWRLVQERVLGTIDGPEPTIFASVSAIEVGADGRIFVLDRQTNELRIFSPEGEHVRSVGRTGGGPGEYISANGVRWIADDSLVVIDQEGNRYSILDGDGEYVRSVPRSLGFFAWNFRGGHRLGRLYEQSSVGRGDAARPALFGISLVSDVAADQATLVVSPEDAAPSRALSMDTTLLPVFTSGPEYASFRVQNERGGMVIGVPFAPRSVYHIDDGGDLWFGRANEFRIIRSTFAGDTTMEILLDDEPMPVTDQDIAQWQDGPGATQFVERGGRIDLDRIPRVRPFFDDLIVDDEGNLWAFRPVPGMQLSAAVFDPRGRYLGRVEADGFYRDTYTAPVIRNGRLYVVGRDDLDVQRVYVLRIEESATT